MIQCHLCEDWFHDHCITAKSPMPDDFDCFVCASCLEKHAFLSAYSPPFTCKDATCTLPPPKDIKQLFMPVGWRDDLCKCLKCTNLYASHNLEFITEIEIEHDPSPEPLSFEQNAAQALNRLDRTNVINGIRATKWWANGGQMVGTNAPHLG